MPKAKIIFNRERCIGAAACVAACPKFWQLKEDGKSELLGSRYNSKISRYELEGELAEDDLQCLKEAVNVCPVQAINIELI
ncbi:MAG: ferredoxin [Candidatus Nealsonbacteria bacterium]|nr:ferredoxin [Candidatus Nealsonbacteria bacterium]